MASRIAAKLLWLAVSASVPLRPPTPALLQVDCNAGDSLTAALRQVKRSPGATIEVRGTCVGKFVLDTDGVRLAGLGPNESVLQAVEPASDSAVLSVLEARNVALRGIRVRGGGAGIHFRSSPGASVSASAFEDNGIGIYFEQTQGYVQDSTLHGNQVGLVSDRRSAVTVTRSTFVDNELCAAGARAYSTLDLVDSEVAGSGEIGIATCVEGDLSKLYGGAR